MGWSWALWLCQPLHENLANRVAAQDSARIEDRSVGIPLSSHDNRNAIHVDNLLHIGNDPSVVQICANNLKEHLDAHGV